MVKLPLNRKDLQISTTRGGLIAKNEIRQDVKLRANFQINPPAMTRTEHNKLCQLASKLFNEDST